MKTLIAAAALSLISAASFANIAPSANNQAPVQYLFVGDTLTPVFTAPLTKARGQVLAELKASQMRMDYVFMGDTWVPRTMFMSERSREEVHAEAVRVAAIDAMLGDSRH